MDFLVTGGAGFIGSHLVEALLARGASVRVVDSFVTGRRANLAPFEGKIELIEGSLADPAVCRRAVDGVRVVLHEAAIPSVPKSIADPVETHRANVDGTFQLLLAARDAGVRRVVYAASSSAYGELAGVPKVETMASSPLSPYAAQKLAGENYCRVFSACYGLQTISMRYFNVFGPRQDPKSQYAAAIPAFITAILRGEPPTIYGDGEQTRDFTYIDNIAAANLIAAQAETTAGEVINVACGARQTLNEVIAQINAHLKTNIKPRYVDARPGDIRHSYADVELARRVIGFRPTVPFEEGLRRTIDWYRKNPM